MAQLELAYRPYRPSPDRKLDVWLRDDNVLRIVDVKKKVVDTVLLDQALGGGLVEAPPFRWFSNEWLLVSLEPALAVHVRRLEVVDLESGTGYSIRDVSPDGRWALGADGDERLSIGRVLAP